MKIRFNFKKLIIQILWRKIRYHPVKIIELLFFQNSKNFSFGSNGYLTIHTTWFFFNMYFMHVKKRSCQFVSLFPYLFLTIPIRACIFLNSFIHSFFHSFLHSHSKRPMHWLCFVFLNPLSPFPPQGNIHPC